MDMNMQRSTTHTTLINTYLERRFIEPLLANLQLAPLGKRQVLRKGEGKTVTFTKYASLTADTTALTEGVPPDGQSLSTSQVTATLYQYGNFVSVTDIMNLTAITPMMEDAVDRLSYQARLTIDTLVRDELISGITAQYADASSPKTNASSANVESDTAAVLSCDEIRVGVAALRGYNAPTFEDGLYRLVIHPNCERDLMAESAAGGFVPTVQYTSHKEIESGLIKPLYGAKITVSSNIKTNASSTHVRHNILLAKDAFGIVDLESAGLKMIVKPMTDGGHANPLDQFGTVGYKFSFAVKTLDASLGRIIEAYAA